MIGKAVKNAGQAAKKAVAAQKTQQAARSAASKSTFTPVRPGGFGVGFGGSAGANPAQAKAALTTLNQRGMPAAGAKPQQSFNQGFGRQTAQSMVAAGAKPQQPMMKKGGKVPSKMGAVKTSAKRDGVATKGKTKGTQVKMAKGGKYC